MRAIIKAFACLAVVSAGVSQAFAQTSTQAAQVRTLKFDRIAASLPAGQVFANAKVGLLCIPREKVRWDTGRDDLDLKAFSEVFYKEALALGLPVADDPTSLFADAGESADLLIGASIYQLSMDVCAPWAWNISSVKGSATIGIEWQIYSKAHGRVMHRVRTVGEFRTRNAVDGGLYTLLYGAFRANIQNLSNDAAFRAMLRS